MARLWFLAVALVILLSAGNSLAGRNKNKNQNKNKIQNRNKNQNKNIPMSRLTPMSKKATTNKNTPMDSERLANLVKGILDRYQPTLNGNPIMFAMAVSIPYNQKRKKFDLDEVRDDRAAVRNKIEKCLVYTGKDIVAATVLKYDKVKEQCPDTPVEWRELLRGCPNVRTWAEFESNLCPLDVRNKNLEAMKKKNQLEDHGEYRVLQHFDTLVKRRTKKSLLLFYSWGSPCDYKCTNQNYQNNILNAIANIKKWKNYVFVFSKPYKRPREVNQQTLQSNARTALTNLGNKIDLSNIFRCDKGNNGRTACKSCSNNGKVSDFCVSG